MSHTIELKDTHAEVTAVTDSEIHADSPAMIQLYQTLEKWHDHGITQATLVADGGPLAYIYLVEHPDGDCTETWLFSDGDDNDPEVTVALPAAWPLSRVEFGIALRHQLIELRLKVGLVSFTGAMNGA